MIEKELMVKACLFHFCVWLIVEFIKWTICYKIAPFIIFSLKSKSSSINANEWKGKDANSILTNVPFLIEKLRRPTHWKQNESKYLYFAWFNYYKLPEIRLKGYLLFFSFSIHSIRDNHLLFTMWLYFSLHNFKCIYCLFYYFFFCYFYRFYWLVSLFAFILSPFQS